jgi:hypothetical protein
MLSVKQKNQQAILPIVLLRVGNYTPPSQVRLASTLCTQGLFTLIAGAA